MKVLLRPPLLKPVFIPQDQFYDQAWRQQHLQYDGQDFGSGSIDWPQPLLSTTPVDVSSSEESRGSKTNYVAQLQSEGKAAADDIIAQCGFDSSCFHPKTPPHGFSSESDGAADLVAKVLNEKQTSTVVAVGIGTLGPWDSCRSE